MTVTETEHIYVDYKNWDKDPRQKLPTIEKFEEFLKAFTSNPFRPPENEKLRKELIDKPGDT